MKKELEDALLAVAQQQGRDPNQLLAELLRDQLQPGQPQQQAPQALPAPQQQPAPAHSAQLMPPGHQMPSQAAPVQMQMPQRYAGVPPPQSEGDIEVLLRYLEAESGPSGVFGDGGMSAGGVFGSAPVATAGYDPGGEQRAATHALARMGPQLLQALQQAAAQPHYPQPAPQMPAPQPVRMITHTTTTIYEGPHHLPAPQAAPMPMLPWWGRR